MNASPTNWAAREVSALRSCEIPVLGTPPGSLAACPNAADVAGFPAQGEHGFRGTWQPHPRGQT